MMEIDQINLESNKIITYSFENDKKIHELVEGEFSRSHGL